MDSKDTKILEYYNSLYKVNTRQIYQIFDFINGSCYKKAKLLENRLKSLTKAYYEAKYSLANAEYYFFNGEFNVEGKYYDAPKNVEFIFGMRQNYFTDPISDNKPKEEWLSGYYYGVVLSRCYAFADISCKLMEFVLELGTEYKIYFDEYVDKVKEKKEILEKKGFNFVELSYILESMKHIYKKYKDKYNDYKHNFDIYLDLCEVYQNDKNMSTMEDVRLKPIGTRNQAIEIYKQICKYFNFIIEFIINNKERILTYTYPII